jgi:hypothetical protein
VIDAATTITFLVRRLLVMAAAIRHHGETGVTGSLTVLDH